MKTLNKVIFVLLGSILFFSCGEESPEREPAPFANENADVVYFSTPNLTFFEVEPEEPSISIEVKRCKYENAISVPIKVRKNDGNVFVFPETVNFEAGEETVTIEISYPEAELATEYTFDIALEGDHVNVYSTLSSSISATVSRVKWELYATGMFNSSFYEESWEQELFKALGTNKYRFYGPYYDGYTIDFEWDGIGLEIKPLGFQTVHGGVPVVRVETGERYSDGSMIYNFIDPDPEYTYFDIENKVLNINGYFGIYQGASIAGWGWLDEVFEITEIHE